MLICTLFTFKKKKEITKHTSLSVPTGLGGNPTNPVPPPSPGTVILNPQCPPGTCFRQNMCIPADSGGFRCAPCPDGYTGDGMRCDDVDEVDTMRLKGTCVADGGINKKVYVCVC